MKTKLVKVNCVSEIDSNKQYVLVSEFGDKTYIGLTDPFKSYLVWIENGRLYEVVEVNWWEDVPEEGILLIRTDGQLLLEHWTRGNILDQIQYRLTESWRPATKEDIEKLKELVK